MSVYTELSSQEIAQLLTQFDLGDYKKHQGIKAGVENTNYFVTTSEHELVLTLFETLAAERLPFYLLLCEHLNQAGCAVPRPYRQNSGDILFSVKNKPAVLVERAPGGHIDNTEPYLEQISSGLAQVHLATANFEMSQDHSHGLAWIQHNAAELMASLPTQDQALLNQALAMFDQLPELPSGIIHADLFQDNALFDNGKISGIIDWYFAGYDSYALDIAITLNDWCLDDAGNYNKDYGDTFLTAYQHIRPLTLEEQQSIPLLQVQSATRFWLSRILAQRAHGESDDNITVKDPEIMKALLVNLIAAV